MSSQYDYETPDLFGLARRLFNNGEAHAQTHPPVDLEQLKADLEELSAAQLGLISSLVEKMKATNREDRKMNR